EHPGLEEGAVDDQLPAAFEQVEQAHFALWPLEFVRLRDGHPRHPPALGGQRVTGARQGFFLHEHLPVRRLPRRRRHDWRRVHSEISFVLLHVSRFVFVHVSLLFLFVERGDYAVRLEISFSQGAEWKALISKYIGTIPLSGDASSAPAQSISGGPPPRTVSSAMIAKVGAAARHNQSAAPRAAAPPFS